MFKKFIIEGFYGGQWSWSARKNYADFIASINFDGYFYAPKGDQFLRQQWQDDWPVALLENIIALRAYYQQRNIGFGMGLSPLGLVTNYNAQSRAQLDDKIQQLNDLQLDYLAILFDDMPGEYPQLAQEQLAIVEQICQSSNAKQFLVCPSYYSFDPILEEVFGQMPKNYLVDLGANIDPSIDIFWTGNKVISDSVSVDDLHRASELLRRKPILWDNLLANDGRKTADFLPFKAVDLVRCQNLQAVAAGQCINPMKQPALSQLAIAALAKAFNQSVNSIETASVDLSGLPSALAQQLRQDIPQFRDVGLAHLGQADKESCLTAYSLFEDQPVAQEIVAWLRGEYQFDPACLTE